MVGVTAFSQIRFLMIEHAYPYIIHILSFLNSMESKEDVVTITKEEYEATLAEDSDDEVEELTHTSNPSNPVDIAKDLREGTNITGVNTNVIGRAIKREITPIKKEEGIQVVKKAHKFEDLIIKNVEDISEHILAHLKEHGPSNVLTPENAVLAHETIEEGEDAGKEFLHCTYYGKYTKKEIIYEDEKDAKVPGRYEALTYEGREYQWCRYNGVVLDKKQISVGTYDEKTKKIHFKAGCNPEIIERRKKEQRNKDLAKLDPSLFHDPFGVKTSEEIRQELMDADLEPSSDEGEDEGED